MKKTLVVTSLLLLLAPATILTTIFLSTPSNYVRVQANGCFTAYLSASTITEGTVTITVSGTDTCDPPNTQVSAAVHGGACFADPVLSGPVFVFTDASSAYSLELLTATLSPGSYCVSALTHPGGGRLVSRAQNPLTVTSGWTNVYSTPAYTYTYQPATSTTFTYTYSTSSLPPPGPGFDFSLALSPSSLSVAPGGTASYQILITYSNPAYSGTTITVQGVTGLGAGMNYQIIPSPPGLRISTSQSTPTGSYTITLIGSAMGVVRQTSAVLLVQAAEQPFDFSVMVSPSQQNVAPGGSTSYTVTVSLVSGDPHRAAVELSVPDAPAGVSASFNPQYGHATFTSTMSVTVDSSVASRTVTLTVTGKWWIAQTGETRTHTAPATLMVSQAADFRVEASPPSQTALQGQTASYAVHVVGLNGFSSQVSLMVSGLPAGVSGVFSVPSGVPDFTCTLTLTVPSGAPTGSFTLTITGTGGGINRVANVVLVINPTAQTASSQSTTQAGGASTPSGLLETLQQNSLLVVGMLGIIIILLGVLALRGRRPAYAPPYPPQPQPSSITCGGCGTQNPWSNEFCSNCGRRLR